MIELRDVTLIGVDCVDIDRLRYVADICCEDISFGAVKLLSSIVSDDARSIVIPTISSRQEYSEFIITQLTNYIDTPYALIFQYDGFILNPQAWTDDFLQYDYIGAVWTHLGEECVGNGGFSLRSKRLLDYLAHNYKNVKALSLHPEDLFISFACRPQLEQERMRFAPPRIAHQFSFEGNDRSVTWNGEFGFHGLGYTDVSRWITDHNEHDIFLAYSLSEFAQFMIHPRLLNEKVHTIRFDVSQLENYEHIASGIKHYEARPTKAPFQYDYSTVEIGDIVVCKKVGFPVENSLYPVFARTVRLVEHFPTLAALSSAYANIQTTTLPLDTFIASTDIGANTPAPNRLTPYTLIHFSEHNLDIAH